MSDFNPGGGGLGVLNEEDGLNVCLRDRGLSSEPLNRANQSCLLYVVKIQSMDLPFHPTLAVM